MLFTFFQFTAFAFEDNASEYDELMELACEVFPEYAMAIRGEDSGITTYSQTNNQVIHQETREISDSESLSITMFSNGEVIVLRNNHAGQVYLTTFDSTSSEISTVGVTGSATFEVGSSQWNYFFRLSDVRYTIYYTGSDYFTSYGTPYSQVLYSVVLESQSNTYIEYTLHVKNNSTDFYEFKLYFSNDQLIAQVG